MRFDRVWNLVEKLEKMGLRNDDWFHLDSEKAVAKQTSVVRTNCMDW